MTALRTMLTAVALTFLLTATVWAQAPAAETDIKQTPTDGLKEVTTDSGLKYYDIKVGEGDPPPAGAKVKVHYTGWLMDGTIFDSSVRRGKPAAFRLDRVIKGWTEGVGSMRKGGKRKLTIPSDLAYGSRARPKIPADSTLIFEVELLDIVQPPKPSDVEGLKLVTTDSGLKYYDIKVGTGDGPSPTSTVVVHYSGWLKDGTLFDSSVERGQPISFPLNGVIKGWTEGVGSMKVGGKRQLIIPPELGYGAQGAKGAIPPNATLTFDVELIDIK